MPTGSFFPQECLDSLANRMTHLRDKRILVTGGTGFVGRHLLPLLVKAGADVRCFIRSTSRTDHLPAQVQVITGSLENGSALAQAMSDCDTVVHMAGVLFSSNWQDYLRGNVYVAEILTDAWRFLRSAGHAPRRMVFVSSLAASGPEALAPGKTDAQAEDGAGNPVSAYGWSKFLTEQVLSRTLGPALVSLRPPIIYGSGDRGLLPVFKGLKKGIAFIPGYNRAFPVSAIHAIDVAQAIMLACKEEAHDVYHLSDGHVYALEQFYGAIATALGRNKNNTHMIHLPLWFSGLTAATATTYTAFTNAVRRSLGKPVQRAPQWNIDKFREAKEQGWLCDNSRIRTDLGFAPIVDEIAQGMEEAVTGYRNEGLL